MTDRVGQVATQLRDELDARVAPLAVLAGADASIEWPQALNADRLAFEIVQATDPRLSAQTSTDVMCALWPAEDPPFDWWTTPLGRALAAAGAIPDTETVSRSEAAAMLGVSPGTVATLTTRGDLERAADGSILVTSVQSRIARMNRVDTRRLAAEALKHEGLGAYFGAGPHTEPIEHFVATLARFLDAHPDRWAPPGDDHGWEARFTSDDVQTWSATS